MNCLVISDHKIAVCGGGGITIRTVRHCPTCKQRRRFTGTDEAWYGVTITCCSCGDSWSCGELLPRPFKPRWRREAAAKARTRWASAVSFGSPEYREFIRAEIGFQQAADPTAPTSKDQP